MRGRHAQGGTPRYRGHAALLAHSACLQDDLHALHSSIKLGVAQQLPHCGKTAGVGGREATKPRLSTAVTALHALNVYCAANERLGRQTCWQGGRCMWQEGRHGLHLPCMRECMRRCPLCLVIAGPWWCLLT